MAINKIETGKKRFVVQHGEFNNCIAKWRMGAWDEQGLPLEASQLID